ncbi:MAG: hypothetical protein ABI585_13580 [Betaproteobacteria bacterium]
MSGATILVDAAVSVAERPVVAAFRRQFAECLVHASGDPWQVEARVHDTIDTLAPGNGAAIVVASLQTELDGADTIDAIGARWRERLRALVPHAASVLLCTIARCVEAPLPAHAQAAMPPIERIRRLDLLAVELSHDTGAAVADVDRIVAHIGARTLGADHRLASAAAVEVAAWTILATLVSGGTLDDHAGPGATERARGYLGTLAGIAGFVRRRLSRP